MFDRTFAIAQAVIAIVSGVTFTTATRAESLAVATRLDTVTPTLSEGTHVYGSVPQAQQIGETYMVFEVQGDRVVGGFYQPHSSFDCFYGDVDRDRLALNIIDSYRNDTYAYNIALTSEAVVADGQPTAPVTSLQGFHELEHPSHTSQRVLETCQAAVR